MLAPFVIFSLLTTTCSQQCANCVPQQRQYQYVVNVPVVPVQGVAVPSNPSQACCNGVPAQATQVIWYSNSGNGQQNSGMLSNFTAISTQNGFNYQNPGASSVPPQQFVTNQGGYLGPSTPITNQGGFTSPPPNYNPNVYLQGSTTSSPVFTGQTLSPSGVPFVPPGNQPYDPGMGQQVGAGGTYNQANTGFMENQGNFQSGPIVNQGGPNPYPNGDGNFQTGPVVNQGGPNQSPNGQGNFNGQEPEFQGNPQFNPNPNQGVYPGQQGGQYQQGEPGDIQYQMGPEPYEQGGVPQGQEQIPSGGYPPQGQMEPSQQYNPQGGPVGNNGMTVNSQYQGPPQGSGVAGSAIAGGVAGAAAGSAAAAGGFPYSTSSVYSTTTPIPRTNTAGPSMESGFPYSTQNPNQPNFNPNFDPNQQSSVYPVIGSAPPGSSPYPNQQGQFGPTTMSPNFAQGQQGQFQTSMLPDQQMQGNMYTTGGPGNPPPNYQGNDGQFNPSTGFPPQQQQQIQQQQQQQLYPGGTFGPGSDGSPYPTTPENQFPGGSATPYPPGSTPGNFQPTGNYPPGAQQDQAPPNTLPPNVNVGVGGGQPPTTFAPGISSSQGLSSLLGQGPSGSMVTGPPPTTPRPFYDTSSQQTFNPGFIPTTSPAPVFSPLPGQNPFIGGVPQQTGQIGLSSTVYPPNYSPVGGGASGGAGYTPQYDFEHNMNTQYGRYNQSTSPTGSSRDAPQPTQATQSARFAGSLHLVLLAVISLLFI